MTSLRATPNWVWLLLIAAVFGVSSAGALFQQVDDVPPLLRASWRLQLTSLVLAPLAIMQWRVHGQSLKNRFTERETILWLLGGGIFLALHFGAWVASLDETSLTHSLLFVTAHPLIIVFGMALIAKYFVNYRSPSRWEIIGACIGFIGAALVKKLLVENKNVIGLDNINDYYDPSLKRSRLSEILKIQTFHYL